MNKEAAVKENQEAKDQEQEEEAPEPTMDDVQKKIDAGEELSEAEEIVLMKSQDAPEDYGKTPGEEPTEEKQEGNEDDNKDDKKEDKEDVTDKDKENTKDKKDDKDDNKPEDEDIFVRLERELAKEPGQENLTDFTDREKAYYHSMRKSRDRVKKAEEERDAEKFKNIKLKHESKKEDEPAPEPDVLKDKDDTDFLTVGEVKELLKGQKDKPAEGKEDPGTQEKENPVRLKYLEMSEKEARAAHPDDFDAVMELTKDILNENEGYLMKVAQALVDGGNPAEVAYQLIKGDPAFSDLLPAAEARVLARKDKDAKEDEKPEKKADDKNASQEKSPEEKKKIDDAKKKEEALKANEGKTKTTGNMGGAEATSQDLTMEQVVAMSDLEFAQLPKATREKYLKLYGT